MLLLSGVHERIHFLKIESYCNFMSHIKQKPPIRFYNCHSKNILVALKYITKYVRTPCNVSSFETKHFNMNHKLVKVNEVNGVSLQK
jgi:hypothetical protein